MSYFCIYLLFLFERFAVFNRCRVSEQSWHVFQTPPAAVYSGMLLAKQFQREKSKGIGLVFGRDWKKENKTQQNKKKKSNKTPGKIHFVLAPC